MATMDQKDDAREAAKPAADQRVAAPKVVWDDSKMKTTYANVCNVLGTREEIMLLFGANQEKGLRLNPKKLSLEVVKLGEDGITLDDIAVHDETNPMLASMLARMTYPDVPVAVGVLFAERRPTYDGTIGAQQRAAKERAGTPDLQKLLRGSNTWTI